MNNTSQFRTLKKLLISSLLLSCIPLTTFAHGGNHHTKSNDWPSYGGDLQNTGQARQDGSPNKISKDTVTLIDGMRVKWIYETTPHTFIGQDSNEDYDQDPAKASGAILSPPAVSRDGYLYFADTLGYVHAIHKNFKGSDPNQLANANADNDPKTWKTFAPTAYSKPGKFFLFSRNTPALDEGSNTLFFGNQNNPYLSMPRLCQSSTEPFLPYDPSFENIRAQCAASSTDTPKGRKYGIGNGVPTDGAVLIAVNRLNGKLKWSTLLDKHPWSLVTQSPVIYNGIVYVGIASREELTSRVTKEPPSFQGSMVAVDAQTGQVLWKTYVTPLNEKPTNDVVNIGRITYSLKNPSMQGSFTGVSIWGTSPAIDPTRRKGAHNGMVLVGTGENYTVPNQIVTCWSKQLAGQTLPDYCYDSKNYEDNHVTSVVAFDLKNGKIIWASKFANDTPYKLDKKKKILQGYFDTWNSTCEDAGDNGVPNPRLPLLFNHCSAPGNLTGMDGDIGQAPMLLTVKHDGPKEILIVGQKTGSLWAMDRESGQLLRWWGQEGRVKLGLAGKLGGIAWGSATDGKTIFTSTTNSRNLARLFSTESKVDGVNRDVPVYIRVINPPSDIATNDTIIYEAEGMREFYDTFRNNHRERLTTPLPPLDSLPLMKRDAQGNLLTLGGVWHAIDAASGRIKWQRPDTAGYLSHPSMTVADGRLFLGTKNASSPIRILDTETGIEIWRSSDANGTLAGNVGARPAVVDGVAYWPMGYISLKGIFSREKNRLLALAPEKVLAPKRFAVGEKQICLIDPSRKWDPAGAAFFTSLANGNPLIQAIANTLNTGNRLLIVNLYYPIDKNEATNRLMNGSAHKLRVIEHFGGDATGFDRLRRNFVETFGVLTALRGEFDVKQTRLLFGSGTAAELKMNVPDALLPTYPSLIWPFPDDHEKILGPNGLLKISTATDLTNSIRANAGAPELSLVNSQGEFPLVILSHGTLSQRNQIEGIAETLAGQGYIVAAIGHTGDNANSQVGINCPAEFASAQPPVVTHPILIGALSQFGLPPLPGLDVVGLFLNSVGNNSPLDPVPGLGLPSASTLFYDSQHQEYNGFYPIGSPSDPLHTLDRILDIRFVITQVKNLDLFKVGGVTKVSQTKTGLIGYSRGGIVAPYAAELLPEIKAAMSFNGGTPTRLYGTQVGPGQFVGQPLYDALNGGTPVTQFTKPLLYTINDEDTVLRDLLFSRVTTAFNTLAGLGIPVNPYNNASSSDPNPIVMDNCQISKGPAVIVRYRNADHTDYTTMPFNSAVGNDPDLSRPRAFDSGRYFGHYPHERFAIRDNIVVSFMDIFLRGNDSSDNVAKLVNDQYPDISVFHKNLPGSSITGLGGCQ